MASREQPDRPPEVDATWRGEVKARARWLMDSVREHRRASAMVAVSAVVVAYGTWLVASSVWDGSSTHEDYTLSMALTKLDQEAYSEARHIAETLRDAGAVAPEDAGTLAFVLGALAAHNATSAWEKERIGYHLLAARYLEEARDRGLPRGRQAQGLYLLGRSQFLAGQLPACRPNLTAALKYDPPLATEIHKMLATAYLEDANPQLDKALEHNEKYLADAQLSTEERYAGLLDRARILFRLGQDDACRAALDQIPELASMYSEMLLVRGQLLMREAERMAATAAATDLTTPQPDFEAKYRDAIKMFRTAQGRATLQYPTYRRSMYLTGVCYLAMGDVSAALGQLERTYKLHPDTPEALAASIEEAELQRQAGRDDRALAAYRRAVSAAGDPRTYSNPWISLDELRSRLLAGYQFYLDAGKFESSREIVGMLYPMVTREQQLERQAECHQAWGRALLARAETAPFTEAEKLRTEGRYQLRAAGSAFRRLAHDRIATRKYPDDVWNSAENYLAGRGFDNAVKMLETYLTNETRSRRPEALLGLATALLSQDKPDAAIPVLRECIEYYPKHAASFEARLLLAKALVKNQQLESAEAVLLENLHSELLTPAGREWRDSLFALGRMLYETGRYDEAIERLSEAIERYPDHPESLDARYHVAEAYRLLARVPREKADEQIAEGARAHQIREMFTLLERALVYLEQLRDVLNERLATTELSPLEDRLLRNAYFSLGATLWDLERYEQAIKTYSTVTNRYQSSPVVLLAYVEIASCHRRLGNQAQARGTIEQAKVVLRRLGANAPYEMLTNRTYDEWTQHLDRLSKR